MSITREEIINQFKELIIRELDITISTKLSDSKYFDEIINLLFSKLNLLISQDEFKATKQQLLTELLSNNSSNNCTASLRAPDTYNLTKAMSDNSDLFQKFGGHPQAAGFSAVNNNLNCIKKSLSSSLNTQSKLAKINAKLYISSNTLEALPKKWRFLGAQKQIIEVNDIGQLNIDLLTQITSLDPFGIDFPMPQFLCILRPKEIKSYKLIGDQKTHIKLYFWSTKLSVTCFNVGNINILTKIIDENTQLENSEKNILIVSKLSENIWKSTRSLELIAEYIDWY